MSGTGLTSTLFVIALLLLTADVEAKPHDIRIHLKLETVTAVHAPTGCHASVELNDGKYTRGFITDPLCLPHGVARRYIPAREGDFRVTDPRPASLTNR